MESKHNNIFIFSSNNPKSSGVSLSISIEAKVNSLVLDQLKCKNIPMKMYKNTDMTCICYSIYQSFKQQTIDNPLVVNKTRANNVDCGVDGEKFVIQCNTQGSLTYVKKCITIIIKCLNIGKLFSQYEKNMKSLELKSNRPVFNKYLNLLMDSISKKIDISITGRINLNKKDKDKKPIPPSATLNLLLKSLPVIKNVKIKAPLEDRKDYVDNDLTFPEVKCSGPNRIILYSYISSSGLPVKFSDNGLYVMSHSWETISKKLKDKNKIKKFISQKFTNKSLKDSFPVVFGYYASNTSNASPITIRSIISSGIKSDIISENLYKSL